MRRPWLLLLLTLAALVAAVALAMKSRETPDPQASPAAGVTETTPPTTAPATGQGIAQVAAPAPEVLVGIWHRTDGDYALNIRRIAADGRAEAAYTNPAPINVSRAEVKQDGGRLVLFVELWDVGYPGSTYMLGYRPEHDALVGSYLQPANGNTYEVAFLRAK